MLFRVRPERRTRILDDLRQVEKLDIRLQSSLEGQVYLFTGLPDWCNKTYRRGDAAMNPYTVTCSCQQFTERSGKYQNRDARGLCRHLVNFYKQKINEPAINLGVLFAEAALKVEELHLVRFEGEEGNWWFSFAETANWIQVYIQDSAWMHASYDLSRQRWAYGLPPANRSAIEQIINTHFTTRNNKLPGTNE